MPGKAICCLLCWLLAASLSAVVTEDSASSNALSGITLLSHSLSDLNLSPTIPATGAAFSYHFPYSMASCGVYSLNTATALAPFILNSGAGFLEHDDYRWQDFRLGLALHWEGVSLGYSEHLIYEKISTGDSYHTWTGDLALSFRGEEYGTEVKLLRMGTDDSELHLTAGTSFIPEIKCASTYVYAPHGEDSYRFASSYEIADICLLQVSWQNRPPRFGAGLKFRINNLEIMYGLRSHSELNLSHALDLGFSW